MEGACISADVVLGRRHYILIHVEIVAGESAIREIDGHILGMCGGGEDLPLLRLCLRDGD